MDWDFIYRGETRLLDDAARSQAGGSFVTLPLGCTHYELAGSEGERPPVVLVHGFSVPYFIWDPTFDMLAAAGRRVLRFDLFGRGYSDRPHVRYTVGLFAQQIAELLDALHMPRVDLVGLSMGGVVSAAFTVAHPERVRKLALIDPIGTHPMPLSMLYEAALLPGVSEILLSLFGTEKMVAGAASDFFDPGEIERYQARYRVQMQFRGFKRAILSTLRNRAVSGSPETYAALGRLPTPVMLLWGREDRTLPVAQSASILRAVPRAVLHIIEHAGHLPHIEQPQVVDPLLLEFLDR